MAKRATREASVHKSGVARHRSALWNRRARPLSVHGDDRRVRTIVGVASSVASFAASEALPLRGDGLIIAVRQRRGSQFSQRSGPTERGVEWSRSRFTTTNAAKSVVVVLHAEPVSWQTGACLTTSCRSLRVRAWKFVVGEPSVLSVPL